jgi:hypothetical protein
MVQYLPTPWHHWSSFVRGLVPPWSDVDGTEI